MAFDETFEIDFATLAPKWLDLMDGRAETKDNALRDNIVQWQNGRDAKWTGCTHSQMRTWISDGYEPPEIEGAFGEQWSNDVPRRKLRFTDEGELDVGMALSGNDFPFMRWDRRPRKPGLAIHVDLALACSTKASVIAEYGAWLGSVIRQFEMKGFDLEISISIPVRGLRRGSNKSTDVLIRVKRENEATDFTSWSSMFSPGGFRMLGFTAMSLAAESFGYQACGSLGYPMGESWRVEFMPESRLLRVESPKSASSFPAEKLSAELAELGI